MCAADHGTTTGYTRADDGSVFPKLLTRDNPQALEWGLKIQQDVINAYVDDVLAVLTAAEIDILDCMDGLARGAAVVTSQVIGSPSRKEAIALGSFPHASDQLHNVFGQVAPPLPLSLPVFAMALSRLSHTDAGATARDPPLSSPCSK